MSYIRQPQQQESASREKQTHIAALGDLTQQQQKAANAASTARKNLNQTMKAALALDTAEGLTFQTKHTKGVRVFSRRISPEDLKDNNITKFVKSPSSVVVLADLTEEDIRTQDTGKQLELLELLGLIDGGGMMRLDVGSTVNGNITVQFPLKGYYDKNRVVNVRFLIGQRTESRISITSTNTEAYKLLRGEDPENHAHFFRLIPEATAAQMVRECVVVFNRDHRIEMSMVMPPGQTSKVSAASESSSEAGKKLLQFLSSRAPGSRYVASTGPDNGFPNEHDVVANTSHMRASTRVVAQLLWVHEGLCSVVASMAMSNSGAAAVGGPARGGRTSLPPLENAPKLPADVEVDALAERLATTSVTQRPAEKWGNTDEFVGWLCSPRQPEITWRTCINFIHNYAVGLKSDKKPDAKFVSTSHDDMLRQIVIMANLATAVFTRKAGGAMGMVNLTSPYTSSADGDINTLPYFGYKMTQWLLSSVEQCTLLTTQKDQNARQKPHLRARLCHADCLFRTSGLKSTYTTDVLLDVSRKAYISPWQEMFGTNITSWPDWLKPYSLSAHFSNIPWAVSQTISDKQVSVVLDTKYKIRFVCENFRRSFEGADPVPSEAAVARQNVNWARIRQATPETAALGIRQSSGMIAKKRRMLKPHREKPRKAG